LGIAAQSWSPPAGAPQERQVQCFTGPEPYDLTDGRGRKILGGALRRRLSRGLYQGSLRLEGGRRPDLEAAMTAGLTREWGREPSQGLGAACLEQAEKLAGKYESEVWNRRR